MFAIQYADVLSDGVLLTFENGETLYFSATSLYENQQRLYAHRFLAHDPTSIVGNTAGDCLEYSVQGPVVPQVVSTRLSLTAPLAEAEKRESEERELHRLRRDSARIAPAEMTRENTQPRGWRLQKVFRGRARGPRM